MKLHAFLWSPATYGLIDALGYGWNDGGCRILADALCLWRTDAEPYVIVDTAGTVQHMVTRVDDRYWDGDGISTRHTVLRRWRTAEQVAGARLERLDTQHDLDALPRNTHVSAVLAERLRDRYPHLARAS